MNEHREIKEDGRVWPKPTSMDNVGRDDEEHRGMLAYLEPDLDQQVTEIERETQVLRGLGLLRPFVEGEVIGAYRRRSRKRPMTEAQHREERKAAAWRRQREMLALRAQNDKAIREILRKLRNW